MFFKIALTHFWVQKTLMYHNLVSLYGIYSPSDLWWPLYIITVAKEEVRWQSIKSNPHRNKMGWISQVKLRKSRTKLAIDTCFALTYFFEVINDCTVLCKKNTIHVKVPYKPPFHCSFWLATGLFLCTRTNYRTKEARLPFQSNQEGALSSEVTIPR